MLQYFEINSRISVLTHARAVFIRFNGFLDNYSLVSNEQVRFASTFSAVVVYVFSLEKMCDEICM